MKVVFLLLIMTRAIWATVLFIECRILIREVRQELEYRLLRSLNGIHNEMLQNELQHRTWHAWFFFTMAATAFLTVANIAVMPHVRGWQIVSAIITLALTVSGGRVGVFVRKEERRKLLQMLRNQRDQSADQKAEVAE